MDTGSSATSIGWFGKVSKLRVGTKAAAPVSKRLATIGLICLAALLIVARLHTYQEPLERDITTYAVIAHELLQGRELYSDLWDHKPPGIHLTYVAAELLAGYGEAAVFLLNVLAATVTLAGAYAAGCAVGREAGVWAATFWVLISGDLALQANQPNSEVFINAALLWAFALYVRGEPGPLSWTRAGAIGVLSFAASLYKPHQLVVVAVLTATALALGRHSTRGRQLAKIAMMAGVVVVGWGATWLYFAARGRAQAFHEVVFDYNRAYAGSLLENVAASLRWADLTGPSLPTLAPLALLTGLGIVLGAGRETRRWMMLAAFGLSTHLVIAMPGQFHPHYYQQWFPPLVVGAAWAVVEVSQRLAARPWWVRRSPGLVAILILLAIAVPAYGRPASAWSVEKYGEVFVASKALGGEIDRLLAKDETFYLWGNETGVYFASRRTPPTGIVQAYPFVEWFGNPRRATSRSVAPSGSSLDRAYADLYARAPFLQRLETRLLSDLERTRPELVVQHVAWPLPPARIRDWLREHYRPFRSVGGFVLAYREGGTLHARLRAHDGPRQL
jgi:4-amino-4-deoxy-L-arabinose transferase-like glycosyltransferase